MMSAAAWGPAPPDPTILRPGILTSVTGLRQALVALQSATLEVKRYMLDEASIIYECKTCNNMFRSLGNLIAHKRSFCSSKYKEVKHIYTDKAGKDFSSSQTVFIENETIETVVPEEPFDIQQYSPSFDLLREAAIIKEIKSEPVVSRLLPPRKEGLKSVIDRLASRIEPSIISRDYVVFEPILENSAAAFQTLAKMQTAGKDYRSMKEDTAQTLVVAPTGISMPKGPISGFDNPSSPSSPDNSKENNEVEMRMTFPCPICKKVSYSKISNIYKHLEVKHKKSVSEARNMKTKIKAGGHLVEKKAKHEVCETSGKQVVKQFNPQNRQQELNQPAATTTVRPTEFDLERVKPGPKALLLAKALGLVNENGLGNQKLNKEEEEEVVEERVDSKRARRERRMARSKNPDLEGCSTGDEEDDDQEISFNLDRLSPQCMNERKKPRLGYGGGQGTYLSGEFNCEICDKSFRTPTFLAQHYASGHFRTKLMEDYDSDIKKRKCSLCGNCFEGSRMIVHIGATHKMYQQYLTPGPSQANAEKPEESPTVVASKPPPQDKSPKEDDKSKIAQTTAAKKSAKSRTESKGIGSLPQLDDEIMN